MYRHTVCTLFQYIPECRALRIFYWQRLALEPALGGLRTFGRARRQRAERPGPRQYQLRNPKPGIIRNQKTELGLALKPVQAKPVLTSLANNQRCANAPNIAVR